MWQCWAKWVDVATVVPSERRPHAIQLRRALLDLFTKSGKNRYLQQSVYADTTKTRRLFAPRVLSFFGDATPETFFKALGNEPRC